MARRIAWPLARLMLQAAAVAAVTAMLAAILVSGVGAQTLTQPGSQPKSSAPPATAKPRPEQRLKSCSIYGPGFVNIAGTDTCIKLGGSVTTEFSGHGQ